MNTTEPSSSRPPTLAYSAPAFEPRRYREPISARAMIAIAFYTLALLTPTITAAPIGYPRQSADTLGWEAVRSDIVLLLHALGGSNQIETKLCAAPILAQFLLGAAVFIEVLPALIALKRPHRWVTMTTQALILTAILLALVCPGLLKSMVALHAATHPTWDVSPSPAAGLWVAAFVTLLIRNWKLTWQWANRDRFNM